MSFMPALRSRAAVLPRMSRAFGSSAPRALATPAEQQAQASEGGNPSKPAHYKDVSIYRWVSGDAAEEVARRLQQLRICRIQSCSRLGAEPR